jgi:hypothetical protein
MKVTMHFEEYPASKPKESGEYLTLESDQDGYHDVQMVLYDKDKDEWYVLRQSDGQRMVIYNIFGWDNKVHTPRVRTEAGKIWYGFPENFAH